MHIENLNTVAELTSRLIGVRNQLRVVTTEHLYVACGRYEPLDLGQPTFDAIVALVTGDLYRQQADLIEKLEVLNVTVSDFDPDSDLQRSL